jgi:hypothetical protein
LLNLHHKLKNNLKMTFPNGKIGKKTNLSNNKTLVFYKETKTLKHKNSKFNLKFLKTEIKITTNKIITNVSLNMKIYSNKIKKFSPTLSLKKYTSHTHTQNLISHKIKSIEAAIKNSLLLSV